VLHVMRICGVSEHSLGCTLGRTELCCALKLCSRSLFLPVTPGSSAMGDEAPASAPTRHKGVVKWFNATKGFGFVTPADSGEDLFVHQVCSECARHSWG
jgi:hypothetical protein